MVAASAYADIANGKLGKGAAPDTVPEAREPYCIMDPEEEAVTFRWDSCQLQHRRNLTTTNGLLFWRDCAPAHWFLPNHMLGSVAC